MPILNLHPTAKQMLRAYQVGIFPMYIESEEPQWWLPSTRSVLFLNSVSLSKRTARTFRSLEKSGWRLRVNHSFEAVLKHCAIPRPGQTADQYWLHDKMIDCYKTLHRDGLAHSVEAYAPSQNGDEQLRLVGGVFGISVGRVFCAESMYHIESNASKLALLALASLFRSLGHFAIDAQFQTPHLHSMGFKEISHQAYDNILNRHAQDVSPPNLASHCDGWLLPSALLPI